MPGGNSLESRLIFPLTLAKRWHNVAASSTMGRIRDIVLPESRNDYLNEPSYRIREIRTGTRLHHPSICATASARSAPLLASACETRGEHGDEKLMKLSETFARG